MIGNVANYRGEVGVDRGRLCSPDTCGARYQVVSVNSQYNSGHTFRRVMASRAAGPVGFLTPILTDRVSLTSQSSSNTTQKEKKK